MDKVGTYINQYHYALSTALFVHNYLLNGPKEIVLAAENDDSLLPHLNVTKSEINLGLKIIEKVCKKF